MQREIDDGEKVEGIDFDKNDLNMIQLIDFCQDWSCSTLINHQNHSRLSKFNYINNIFIFKRKQYINMCIYTHTSVWKNYDDMTNGKACFQTLNNIRGHHSKFWTWEYKIKMIPNFKVVIAI